MTTITTPTPIDCQGCREGFPIVDGFHRGVLRAIDLSREAVIRCTAADRSGARHLSYCTACLNPMVDGLRCTCGTRSGAQASGPSDTLRDAAEMLWVVLANVSGGDWTQQSAEWQESAARWRENYFKAAENFVTQSSAVPFARCTVRVHDMAETSVCDKVLPCPDHPAQRPHLLERTSAFGEAFVGTCKLCGTTGLRASQVVEICGGPRVVSGVSTERAAPRSICEWCGYDVSLLPATREEALRRAQCHSSIEPQEALCGPHVCVDDLVMAMCACFQGGFPGLVYAADATFKSGTVRLGTHTFRVRRAVPGTGFAFPCNMCNGSGWLRMHRETAIDLEYPFRELRWTEHTTEKGLGNEQPS
jgi:hypothetical protein